MIDLHCLAGDEINSTIDKALETARRVKSSVCFFFNGVVVIVKADSKKDLVLRDWNRAMNGYLGESPVVGPDYSELLSKEELELDALVEARNEDHRRASQQAFELKERAKKQALAELLANAPALDIVDTEQWNQFVESNKDPYGSGCVRYAEKWGRLMQARIDAGEEIEDVADPTSFQADDEGITGFMHHAAANMLMNCWRFGKPLKDHYEAKRMKQVRSEAPTV